jgi:hypothetical protein
MQTNDNIDNNESDTASQPVGRYAELQRLIAGMAADFEKFYKDGNKAAGTRVRNSMQELKTFAQTIRTEVQSIKNEGPGKENA